MLVTAQRVGRRRDSPRTIPARFTRGPLAADSRGYWQTVPGFVNTSRVIALFWAMPFTV